METEKVVIICITLFLLSFIGAVTYGNQITKQKYDVCIDHGGSWVSDNCLMLEKKNG